MPGRDDRSGDKKSRKPCLRNRRMGGMYKSIKGIIIYGTLCFALEEAGRFHAPVFLRKLLCFVRFVPCFLL